MKCMYCGRETEEYVESNVDENGEKTEEGLVFCSEECGNGYFEDKGISDESIEHWSRITGYYQNLDGWNKGKIQEIKDRQRYGV